MGDFNEIASAEEKNGGVLVDVHRCQEFSQWIDNCRLLDMGFFGSKYTWRGLKHNGVVRDVFKRLDRALCNMDWPIQFHEGVIKVTWLMTSILMISSFPHFSF